MEVMVVMMGLRIKGVGVALRGVGGSGKGWGVGRVDNVWGVMEMTGVMVVVRVVVVKWWEEGLESGGKG